MALFGLIPDSSSSGDDSGNSAFLMPMAAQAMQYDPRSAMIRSIMETGQQQLQQPTYTPLAALAKALTTGIGGASSAMLQSQYADAAKGAPQEIGAALSSSDPLTTLTQSKNPIARMMGFQLAPTIMAKRLEPQKLAPNEILTTGAGGPAMASNPVPLTDIGKLIAARDALPQGDPNRAAYDAQIQKLNSEGGVQLTGNGAAPIPGYGPAKGAIAGETDFGENPALISRAGGVSSAEAPGKIAAAVGTAQGTAPIDVQKAISTAAGVAPIETQKAVNTATGIAPIEANKEISIAAGKAPIEMLKQLFNPIANRTTGAVTIPGVDNPAMVNTILQKFGVSPKQLLDDPSIPSVPVAPVQAQGGSPPPAPAAAIVAPHQASPVPALPQPPVAPASPPQQQGSPSAAALPAPQQQPNRPQGPVPIGTMNPIDEVPRVPLPTGEMPMTAGTISPGRDPIAIKAGEEAVEQGAKQYEQASAAATGASNIHAELATMRTMLQNGGVNTDASAPARATLSSYLNAAFGADVAKRVTGIDPAQAEVFNKDATRMGLSFARQTEGAREAVAAIKIALGANPSLANTMQGNKMIIDLLDAGAQRDMAAQQYSDAWFQKNNSYVGAQAWFNKNHPAAEFTSKVIPYNLPRAQGGSVQADKLEPNVTYNITSQNHTGPAIWTGQGFMPVQQ